MPSLLGDYLLYTQGRTYTPSGQLMDVPKGMAAGLLGVPGDIAQLGLTAHMKARGAQSVPQLPLTSEHIGGLLGANQSDLFNAGLIGAPGPEDVARLAPKGLLAMTLFHGTPHKFDKFDLKAIGTGEGAQAYGHGLYFAESPGVAKSYQNQLAGNRFIGPDGKAFDASDVFENPNIRATLEKTDGDIDAAIDRVGKIQESIPGTQGAELALRDLAKLEELKAKGGIKREAGHLYEVDIPDETIAKMLDWDSPLSEQMQQKLRQVTSDIDFDEFDSLGMAGLHGKHPRDKSFVPTGQDIYEELSDALGGDTAASEVLREAGIPGIRYYDGASRGKGEGTRNIVVFNPDDIKSVKRDGELVYKAGR